VVFLSIGSFSFFYGFCNCSDGVIYFLVIDRWWCYKASIAYTYLSSPMKSDIFSIALYNP